MRARLTRLVLAALMMFAVGAVGCSKPADTAAPQSPTTKEGPTVRVGSLLDSEGTVLGSMVIQMLEANGIKTVDKTKFGTPDVVRKALVAGDLDATIDYTGSGQFYVGPEGDPLWSDATRGYETVRDKDLENGLAWLAPAPANNSEFLGMKKEFAEANNIATMEDFAAFVNKGGKVKLIGAQAWMDSPAGLKGYEKAYGFTLKNDQRIGLSTGVTAEFIKALVNGTDGVNVAEVYGTDGGLAEQGIIVIEDTKGVPPVYAPTPVFRAEIIAAHPEIPEILAPLFQSLTMERLQELNRLIAFGGESATKVAEDYLKGNGFLK